MANLLVLYEKATWPFGSHSKWLLVTVCSHLLADYVNFAAYLRKFTLAFRFWKSFGFFPHLVLAFVTIYFAVIPKVIGRFSKRPHREGETHTPPLNAESSQKRD